MVEFAVGASVLLTTLFGIISLSFALYSYNFVAEAAREASRYAIVRGADCDTSMSDCPITSAEVNTYVQGLSYPGIAATNLTGSATWPNGNSPGNRVSVTVTYSFPLAIPFWAGSGSLIHMSSTSSMVISQ